jgi:hypothetical protein
MGREREEERDALVLGVRERAPEATEHRTDVATFHERGGTLHPTIEEPVRPSFRDWSGRRCASQLLCLRGIAMELASQREVQMYGRVVEAEGAIDIGGARDVGGAGDPGVEAGGGREHAEAERDPRTMGGGRHAESLGPIPVSRKPFHDIFFMYLTSGMGRRADQASARAASAKIDASSS